MRAMVVIEVEPVVDVGLQLLNASIDLAPERDLVKLLQDRLVEACKRNGFKDAHHMKREHGLDSSFDIFEDKNGNMYYGPRQGTGLPQYLHMNSMGI